MQIECIFIYFVKGPRKKVLLTKKEVVSSIRQLSFDMKLSFGMPNMIFRVTFFSMTLLRINVVEIYSVLVS